MHIQVSDNLSKSHFAMPWTWKSEFTKHYWARALKSLYTTDALVPADLRWGPVSGVYMIFQKSLAEPHF